MNQLMPGNLINKSFNINISDFKNTVLISFEGRINIQNPGKILNPFIQQIHQLVRIKGLKQIYCDFTKLYYINSNGLMILLNWIMWINDLPSQSQYHIYFKLNDEFEWQTSTFKLTTMLFDKIIYFQE